MNERIKELKKQAMVKVHSHGAFGESESYLELDPEKFAELIVQECMESAREVANRELDPTKIWPEETYIEGFHNGAKETWVTIRKKFGIK